jgi:uncharacterized protein (TIGR00369 family)
MADYSNLSGRELLQAMVKGDVPHPPMCTTLDFQIVEVGDGYAVYEGTPGPGHLHPGGVVHGGYALTMIDSAAGAAANTLRSAGGSIGTIEIKTNLVRAVTVDTGIVRATGRVISGGRRIIVAEARLEDSAERLLAFGVSTLLHTPA